jgi:large subunit ribosomal protein L29
MASLAGFAGVFKGWDRTMKIGEVREMKTDELHAELERLRRHLFDLRSQAVTEKLENPTLINQTRKDIARVLTVMQERGEELIEQKQLHMEAVAAAGKSAAPRKTQAK